MAEKKLKERYGDFIFFAEAPGLSRTVVSKTRTKYETDSYLSINYIETGTGNLSPSLMLL